MRNQWEAVCCRIRLIYGVALLGAAAAVHAGAGGKVAVWGAASSYLPTNVPPTFTNLVAISGGSSYVLGLNADKTVAAWKGATPDASPTNIPPDLNNVTAIAAGAEHGLALKSDGMVTAWGNVDMFFPGSPGASFNPTNVPAGVSNVVAIAAGDNHSIALKSDGRLVSWGFYENPGVILQSFPATNVPATLTNVIAIAAGGYQNIALKADGTVCTWGVSTAVPAGLSNVVAVACAKHVSLALKASGEVVAWVTTSNQNPPRPSSIATNVPPGLSNVVAIAAGASGRLAMALRADGSVATWGDDPPENPAGLTNVFTISVGGDFCAALTGDGAPRFTIQPASQAATNGATVQLHARVVGVQPMAYRWVKDGVTLPGETNTDLTIASARLEDSGDYALIVVNPFETARSASARLTVFTSPIITLQPAAQTGIAGANVTLTAAATGTMPLSYQWLFKGAPIPGATWTTLALSDIQSGQSGYYSLLASNVHGMAESSGALLTVLESPPYIFTQPTNCTATFGSAVTFSVNARGSMPLGYQWRLNNAEITGATGNKLTLLSARLSDAGFYTVTISNAFGEIVSAQAKLTVQPVAVWGPYSNWPLPPNTSPSFPPSLTDPVAIAGSRYYVLGLNANGTAVVSRNRPGIPIGYIPTSVPEGLSNIAAVAAGRAHCLALQSNGTVQAWGLIDRANPYWSAHNATNVPPNLSKVVGVAAGDQHSLALKQDGTVVSWGLIQGYSSSGAWVTPSPATNVPAGLSNVISVAAGGNQNLALRSDGTVRAWGGGMNVPTGLSNVIAVACGEGLGVALKSDGKVVAWLSSTAALSSRPSLATNVPTGLSNVVAIAAGATGRYAMALQTDGTVVTWGSSNVLTPAGLTNVFSITVGTDFFAALVGDGAPRFTIQPASQTAVKGTNVRLHASAVGIQPLSYQWQLEGVPISGATNASLTLTNFQGRNAGKYRAVVTNALGEAVSAAAVVSIPFNTNLAAALNATDFVWTSEPTNAPWFAQNRETHDGDVAVQSGQIGPNQQSTLHAAVTGPGTLTFWWKVLSEEDYDRLWFSMDALNWTTWISGETDWRQFTYHVPAGSHVLRWAYTKDDSVNEGADAGWLDEVVFTPTAPVKLSAPERLADGTLALSCADANGRPFAPQDRKHFGVETSSNLVDWLALPDAFTWTNGLLQLHDPTGAGQPQRYYRVIAR